MKLATPRSGVSDGRAQRPEEAEIFQLCNKLRLGSDDFSGGNRLPPRRVGSASRVREGTG
jgi:hypothetical protein